MKTLRRMFAQKKHITNPRARSLKGWNVYKRRLKKAYPIHFFFKEIVERKIGLRKMQLFHAKWWVLHRIHPDHRYHVLKTKLKPDYYCFDTVVLHAAFERFSHEYPRTREMIVLKPGIKRELDRLLEWWNVGRPAFKEGIEQAWENLYDSKTHIEFEHIFEHEPTTAEKKARRAILKMESKIAKEETQNLLSLIRLKEHVSW